MKFVRYGNNINTSPKPGAIDAQNIIYDLSSVISEVNAQELEQHWAKLKQINLSTLPIVGTLEKAHIFPCIPRPGRIICIGFNCKSHTEQLGETLPSEPVFFFKSITAICGARDPIIYPKLGKKLDWEAELGVVIGKKGKYIAKEKAFDYVLGYCCAHDISDRSWQFEHPGNQHTKGKSFDTFAPIGPYLVTKDEIHDPSNLHVILKVNDEIRQDFSTKDYVFSIPEVLAFLSQLFPLEPNDIIFMGSGPGNAVMWHNEYLKIGDKIEFSIEGLGTQKQIIVAEK